MTKAQDAWVGAGVILMVSPRFRQRSPGGASTFKPGFHSDSSSDSDDVFSNIDISVFPEMATLALTIALINVVHMGSGNSHYK